MVRFLICCDRAMKDFDAEGLGNLGWALGALRYVPDKMWLRSYVGQVRRTYMRARVCVWCSGFQCWWERQGTSGCRYDVSVSYVGQVHALTYRHAFRV